MSWFPVVLKVAKIAGTALSVAGTIKAGNDAAAAGRAQQAQAYALAQQQREKARMDARNYRLQGARLLSKQRAGMAATGFMSDDPTGMRLREDTIKELTLQELAILTMGGNDARSTEFDGNLARMRGDQAKSSSRLLALGQAAEGFVSWRDLYGGGRPGGSTGRTSSAGGRAPNNLVRAG